MVGNLALRRRANGRDFQTHIRRYTSSNENGYPRSNALVTFSLKLHSLQL